MTGGTIDLFDRKNNRLMMEVRVVEGMDYLNCIYMNCGIKVAIEGLTVRRYRFSTMKRLNKCYRRLQETYGIPFVKTTNFRFRRDTLVYSLHLSLHVSRQPTKKHTAACARFANGIS